MGSKVARTQSPMVSMHSPTFASIHVWNWLKSYASVVDFYRSWNYAVAMPVQTLLQEIQIAHFISVLSNLL